MIRAEALARASLTKAPFNAVAMRILGMSLHARGDTARAEPIMTLAGNWSLRDSPTHLWLFEQRVRTGELTSAFAHLDTVLRRREDLRERLFGIILKGMQSDPRILGPVTERLALAPNWRPSFLAFLAKHPEGRRQAVAIAVNLHRSGKSLSGDETRALASALLASREGAGLKWLSQQLDLVGEAPLRDAGFEELQGNPPFGWEILGGAGASVEILDDAKWNSRALRVEHDGLSPAPLARQLIALAPGQYVLRGKSRSDEGPFEYYWQASCVGGATISEGTAKPVAGRNRLATIRVPASNCDLQWLELRTNLGDRTSVSVAVFDDLVIVEIDAADAAVD